MTRQSTGGGRISPSRQVEQRPIIRPSQCLIEPPLELPLIEVPLLDLGEDDCADQDLPPGIVLASLPGEEGGLTGRDPLLTNLQLLQLRLEGLDPVVELGSHRAGR